MREILTTITSKGQVTIPKNVREHLGISTHDRVAFVLEEDETVRLRVPHYPTDASLAGAAGSLRQKLSWDEMRAIAHEDRFAEDKESREGGNTPQPVSRPNRP